MKENKRGISRIKKMASLVYLHFRLDTRHPFEFFARYFWIFLLCLTQRFFFQTGLWHPSMTLGTHPISLPVFIMSGFAMVRLLFLIPSLFHDTLNHFRENGLLGCLLVTRTSLWEIFAANALWKTLVVGSEFLAVVFFAGVLVEIPMRPFFQWSVLAAAALAIVAYLGIGMLLSAVTMPAKKGSLVFALLAQLSIVFGGVFFPVRMLPEKIVFSAHFIPLTPALEIIRSSLAHADFSEQRPFFWILTGLALFFLCFGILTLHTVLSWMRKQGRLVA